MIVDQVREYVEQHSDETITLDRLSDATGLSSFHLQKVFKQETGMSPRQYVEERRLSAVKRELGRGKDVTSTVFQVGYGSASRLYERSAKQLGMTPGAYKKGGAGETIEYALVKTRLGLVLVAATARGVAFLQFGESKTALVEALRSEFPAARLQENSEALIVYAESVNAYVEGRSNNLNVPLDLRGSTFETAVWRYLREIPAGETRTYADIAKALGKPNAARAVGTACGANTVALAVPCHRVVRSDGGLGGYRWGLERKRTLLESEKNSFRSQPE